MILTRYHEDLRRYPPRMRHRMRILNPNPMKTKFRGRATGVEKIKQWITHFLSIRGIRVGGTITSTTDLPDLSAYVVPHPTTANGLL